ncbi:FAD-dependent monooxygenase [Aliagarivorans marinus]|uniref:FAD-dependent monooxygenase n=1 Tax=Aliagarivorans marinus TaxID=561965 RepID=UPI000403DFB0|nr:FAD-dependent monooxygenase [Aliagarivorans marinus]
MQSVDVAIVGGGMVGLSLACALKDSDLRLALIEAKPPQPQEFDGEHQLRVSALSLSSQRFLTRLGAWQGIVDTRAAAYDDMQVWERDSFAKVRFQASELCLPHIGHIVENGLIRQQLWQQAQLLDNLQVIEQPIAQLHRGESESWLSFENGQAISAKLLVAADGANSWLRQHLDVPLTFWDYQHSAVVGTVRTELPHDHCARQVFSPEGPLALLPLSDPHLCSIVWSVPPERAEQLQAMDAQAFNKAITIAFDARLGMVERQSELASFPLRMRYARDFAGPGFALIGDAAHTIHPLAGQGVNLGFMDAAALAQMLIELKQAGKAIGDYQQLRSFERWRKAEATQMIAAMESFKRLFGNDIAPVKLLRGLGMSAFDKLTPVKQQVMKHALGLAGELPDMARS